jgi:hypothetical protein
MDTSGVKDVVSISGFGSGTHELLKATQATAADLANPIVKLDAAKTATGAGQPLNAIETLANHGLNNKDKVQLATSVSSGAIPGDYGGADENIFSYVMRETAKKVTLHPVAPVQVGALSEAAGAMRHHFTAAAPHGMGTADAVKVSIAAAGGAIGGTLPVCEPALDVAKVYFFRKQSATEFTLHEELPREYTADVNNVLTLTACGSLANLRQRPACTDATSSVKKFDNLDEVMISATATMPGPNGAQTTRHYCRNEANSATPGLRFTLHSAAQIWKFAINFGTDILTPATFNVVPASGDDTINFGTEAFAPNEKVVLGTAGTLPAGLSSSTEHYVRTVTTSTIMLHSASMTQITAFSATADATEHQIDAAGFSDNDLIRFSAPGAGGVLPVANPAIDPANDYYVRKTAAGHFRLHVKKLIVVTARDATTELLPRANS